LGSGSRNHCPIRTAIGATTINPELLTCAERLAIPTAPISGENLDFRMRGEPSLNCRHFSIGQKRHDASSL
jgi:hypothetical protein